MRLANSTALITISIISVVMGLLKFLPHFESISETMFMENHPFVLNFILNFYAEH